MKKILLIIAIAFCIFQLVVMATAIDIGSKDISVGGSFTTKTWVDKNNPANESGKITSIEIFAHSNGYAALANCEVATFSASGNNLTTRDSVLLGTVAVGKNTYTVDSQSNPISLTVVAGDYIGIYWTGTGRIEVQLSGAGVWYIDGDYIPCTAQAFTLAADRAIWLYGIGETAAPPAADNAIFFGINF